MIWCYFIIIIKLLFQSYPINIFLIAKHEQTIDLQGHVIADLRRSCDEMAHDRDAWKHNVTNKDKKMADLLQQLAVWGLIVFFFRDFILVFFYLNPKQTRS